MNKTLKIILPGIILAMALSVASCSKYEGPDLNGQTPVSMNFTSWYNVVNDSITIVQGSGEEAEEVTVDRKTETTLLFYTETEGNMRTKITSKKASKLNKDTIDVFKYVYKIPEGSFTYQLKGNYITPQTRTVQFVIDKLKMTATMANGNVLIFDRQMD